MDIEYIRYLRQTAIALKFSFPPNFKRYSSARLLRCYNGVGAEWMPKLIVKFLTWFCDRLAAPSLLHDFEFVHGKKSYWRFTVANLRLAYNCAKNRRFFVGVAAAIICQVFGWSAYKYGKELLTNGS